MDYQSKVKSSTRALRAGILGLILACSLALPATADDTEPEYPVILIARYKNNWLYEMTDKTVRVYKKKLKDVKDGRPVWERVSQTSEYKLDEAVFILGSWGVSIARWF